MENFQKFPMENFQKFIPIFLNISNNLLKNFVHFILSNSNHIKI